MTWILFDFMGTVAFAISGAMVGIVRRMDIFGITVLAILTAVGGGIVRDVIAGITPPTALIKPTAFILSIVTAWVTVTLFALLHGIRQRKFSACIPLGKNSICLTVDVRAVMKWFYNLSDTVGLAAFTVTGALTGIAKVGASQMILPVTLAVITAVGGGILRDLLAQRVPYVLKMDVYASAALAGAIVLCLTWDALGAGIASWLCFFAVLCLRMGAIRYGWQLYHYRPIRKKFE